MSGSLSPLGDFGKPASILIEKISVALGGIFKPWQMIRVAKAEAEVDAIRAESQIQVTDIHRRALRRFLEEEAKRQLNIEEVTQKALPLLAPESAPQNVEDDWVVNFFERCRLVSDDDMQRLWSKVLAGEANAPGAFSKRTVNVLAELEKDDAEAFTRLCDFTWMLGDEALPLVYDEELGPYLDAWPEIYGRHGINFVTLSALAALGLIVFNGIGEFAQDQLPKKVVLS